jgi:hypothetical protein
MCNMLPDSMFLCKLQLYFACMPCVVLTECCMFIGVKQGAYYVHCYAIQVSNKFWAMLNYSVSMLIATVCPVVHHSMCW